MLDTLAARRETSEKCTGGTGVTLDRQQSGG